MVCSKALAIVQNKDQESAADISAGNDIYIYIYIHIYIYIYIYVKESQGQALLAQLETEKKNSRTNDPETHSVGVV